MFSLLFNSWGYGHASISVHVLVCYYHSISSGTGIDGELAVQFGGVTGSSISLHNLSIATLQADYDPFIAPDRDLCKSLRLEYFMYIDLSIINSLSRRGDLGSW